MSVLMSAQNIIGIVCICVGMIILMVALCIILYIFVFSRGGAKKQIRDLQRKYSYLNALLIGQDSQYIHRLEIISHTNLLYVDIYNDFSKRFKEIYEVDDKFALSKIKQVNNLIQNKQFKNIKLVIEETKKAVAAFEREVNILDRDLYEVIKPEEESRQTILRLKESYRTVKQTFYVSQNELELVIPSFNKAFEKLDQLFVDFEAHIESAEYEEANAIIPTISKVVSALKTVLEIIPNLSILVEQIIPEKLNALVSKYDKLEKESFPLFHLGFRHKQEDFNNRIRTLRMKLINLQTGGVMAECEKIQDEILIIEHQLDNEINDKQEFDKNCSNIYHNVLELEKTFLKICSLLPEIKEIYIIQDTQEEQIEILRENVNKLGQSKRLLDGLIHSNTKQPYSLLKEKLEELKSDYDSVLAGVKEFKLYLDSLRTSSEDAFTMIYAYYYRLKQTEETLRNFHLPEFSEQYKEKISNSYNLINEIYDILQQKPIDVVTVDEKVEELTQIANPLFDEIDNKARECQLAESAILYANRDRNHQSDVHQQLTILESQFFQGEFEKVYHDASAIYRRMHVEDNSHNG